MGIQLSQEEYDADVLAAYEAGRKDERERCARICESVNNHDNPMTAKDCADAIRAGLVLPDGGQQ